MEMTDIKQMIDRYKKVTGLSSLEFMLSDSLKPVEIFNTLKKNGFEVSITRNRKMKSHCIKFKNI